MGSSEWVRRCGGGRYKRRVSGCGRVIVYCMVVPFFFEYVQKRLPGVTQNQAGEIPKRIHTRFKTWRKFEIKNTD